MTAVVSACVHHYNFRSFLEKKLCCEVNVDGAVFLAGICGTF